MTIAHFLITRFNLRDDDFDAKLALDPAWLRYRFDLFEKFCLPTVKAQTNQDFRWLVLFDSETPEPARARIREYQQWKNFVPVFVPAGTLRSARKAVLAHLVGTPDILLTTRLDSDDGICNTFIGDVRRHAAVQRSTVLEFPVGYVWEEGRLYRNRQPRNPFISLAEPLNGDKDFRTVFSGSHSDTAKLGEVKRLPEVPAWLQVIHGGNVENKVRGVRCRTTDLMDRFSINADLVPPRESEIRYQADKARSIAREAARRAVGVVRRVA